MNNEQIAEIIISGSWNWKNIDSNQFYTRLLKLSQMAKSLLFYFNLINYIQLKPLGIIYFFSEKLLRISILIYSINR